jgi:hypothetical protein
VVVGGGMVVVAGVTVVGGVAELVELLLVVLGQV